MKDQKNYNLLEVIHAFALDGQYRSGIPYGSGHINDTFLVTLDHGQYPKIILQRINNHIFHDIEKLMSNISRVLHHLQQYSGDLRSHLTLIPTRNNDPFYLDEKGNYWRAYIFIDHAYTLDVLEKKEQAYEAAKAFGRFQQQLATLPGERLYETIPNFHNTPHRLTVLKQTIQSDPCNRAQYAKKEIEFVLRRESMLHHLEYLRTQQILPEIVVHNDTKINNVLFDKETGKGICVIDLDTVMPGLSLYDFGDMVRTCCPSTPEDEQDLSKIRIRLDVFTELVKGFFEGTNGQLNCAEIDNLVFSGQLITMETGIRFLTDFISGDRYFKIKREFHNLDRAKAQFKLASLIEEHEESLQKIVKSFV